MFESLQQPLASRQIFLRRQATAFGMTLVIVAISLAFGAAGYHYTCGLPWIDATLNAAMILTGMGPVDTIKTTGGKLFATFYALYSGVAFLTMTAVLVAPVIHRAFHRFHMDVDKEDDSPA